jgi:hypothetical protein
MADNRITPISDAKIIKTPADVWNDLAMEMEGTVGLMRDLKNEVKSVVTELAQIREACGVVKKEFDRLSKEVVALKIEAQALPSIETTTASQVLKGTTRETCRQAILTKLSAQPGKWIDKKEFLVILKQFMPNAKMPENVLYELVGDLRDGGHIIQNAMKARGDGFPIPREIKDGYRLVKEA